MTTDANQLGPAERIIQSVLTHTDHLVHNRPGIIIQDQRSTLGVRWEPVTHKLENDQKVVYKLVKHGKKNTRVKLGTLLDDGRIQNGTTIGQYRPAGLYPEVAAWMYNQIAEVWKLDNEFAARWASYVFPQEHRDLKVALAAFMLVQSRKGDPVVEKGETLFHDEDYRNIGEAMILLTRKDKKDLNPKLLLRIHDLLSLPQVAEINRALGFGNSARKPFYGRWPKVVTKWLRYREENPQMLRGLVRAGFRTTVMELARRVGYKPLTPAFFQALRWKQKQADDGHRTMAIGDSVKQAESWEGLSEADICKRIVKERPGWKTIVGRLPAKPGVTRAIVAASMEAGSISDKDLVILTPTLEELGLLEVQDVRERWQAALKKAEDMRAANIARNVRSEKVKEELEEAADTAMKKAVEEVVRDIEVYVMVDISGSMEGSIEAAKEYVAKFLQGFPPERLHVCVFSTAARMISIKHPSAAGVANAFKGVRAGGGTDYGAGVKMMRGLAPKDGADVLFIFVGDEEAREFSDAVRQVGLNPMAFGFVKTEPSGGAALWRRNMNFRASAVRDTAANLGIPCFMIERETFADPYAIPRTIRNLIAATPVGKPEGQAAPKRVSLVDEILKTELLQKPAWA